MTANPTKKLGKLSLAILENLVESMWGEDFVKELCGDFNLNVTLKKHWKTPRIKF